jgi:hypothetical protein
MPPGRYHERYWERFAPPDPEAWEPPPVEADGRVAGEWQDERDEDHEERRPR